MNASNRNMPFSTDGMKGYSSRWFGLPKGIFSALVFFSGMIAYQVSIYIGILLFVLLYVTLKELLKEDENGLRIFFDMVARPKRYENTAIYQKKMKVLVDSSDYFNLKEINYVRQKINTKGK